MYRWLLACVMLVGALVFVVGIDWGLPSAGVDQYLFGGDEPWTGETISQLTDADARAPTSTSMLVNPLSSRVGWTGPPPRPTGPRSCSATASIHINLTR